MKELVLENPQTSPLYISPLDFNKSSFWRKNPNLHLLHALKPASADPAPSFYVAYHFLAELLTPNRFHFVIIPLTVDCWIFRSEEISWLDLLHRWHPISVPHWNSLSSWEWPISSQMFVETVCMPRYLLLNTCGHRSDWNTLFHLFGWVSEHFWQYSVAEVRRSLRTVNSRKAPGPDNIPGRVLREYADQLAWVLMDIFNTSLDQAKVPSSLKATIIPVPKETSMTTGPSHAPRQQCFEKESAW